MNSTPARAARDPRRAAGPAAILAIVRRRLFVVGLAVFAVAPLLVGLAPTAWWHPDAMHAVDPADLSPIGRNQLGLLP